MQDVHRAAEDNRGNRRERAAGVLAAVHQLALLPVLGLLHWRGGGGAERVMQAAAPASPPPCYTFPQARGEACWFQAAAPAPPPPC